VAHLFAFGLEVALVGGLAGDLGGDALDDLDAGELEGFDFFGVVGDEADGGDAHLLEDLGGKLEVAAVGLVAELEVGFDGVEAFVLKLVGAEFGHEADAAALLLLVEHDAGSGFGDGGHGELELLAAVAAEGVEDVAGEALGVDTDDGGGGVDVAHDESYGGFDADGRGGDGVVAGEGIFDEALEAEDAELTPAGGEVGIGYFGNACKRHSLIIRFKAHSYLILTELGRCKVSDDCHFVSCRTSPLHVTPRCEWSLRDLYTPSAGSSAGREP
jgi:hypothetical protein